MYTITYPYEYSVLYFSLYVPSEEENCDKECEASAERERERGDKMRRSGREGERSCKYYTLIVYDMKGTKKYSKSWRLV